MTLLAEWMKERDLKDADVERLLGGKASRSQINRIRNRASRPSIELARELEALTEIPAADFVMAELLKTRAAA